MTHRFVTLAPHLDELLQETTLKGYVKTARRLAESKEALRTYEVGRPWDDQDDPPTGDWSTAYYGDAGEFLAECFFKVYGAEFGFINIKSTADIDSATRDFGVDHFAENIVVGSSTFEGRGQALEDRSPVYIQTKMSTHHHELHSANDGSRITNFMTYAATLARREGKLWSYRTVLFTTKHGISTGLKEMTGGILEVVNASKIGKRIDNRPSFFNFMREQAGLDPLPGPADFADCDAEFICLKRKMAVDIPPAT